MYTRFHFLCTPDFDVHQRILYKLMGVEARYLACIELYLQGELLGHLEHEGVHQVRVLDNNWNL